MCNSWLTPEEVAINSEVRDAPSSRTKLLSLGAYSCVAAALLAVIALVGFFVVVGSDKIAVAAEDAMFYLPAGAALGSVALLAVGLVGLHLHQEPRLGSFGAVATVVALLGTVAAAGASWTYVFIVPHFAPVVPDMINESTGSVLAGFLISYALMSVGWTLFGIATLRTGVFSRRASIALIVGAVIASLPMPSRTLVLAIAAAVLGRQILREPPEERGGDRSFDM